MSEFKVGDRVVVLSGRSPVGEIVGVRAEVRVRWETDSSEGWWTADELKPAPPDPPTLLEAAEKIIALRVKNGREDSDWLPGWPAAIADLAAAVVRERELEF